MNKEILLIFCFVFVFRTLACYLVTVDSDEVMWAVMADEMAHGRQFYTYFATQNFRGALEAYFLIPFQTLLDFSLPILRINSILFGALTSVVIYNLFVFCSHSEPFRLGGTGEESPAVRSSLDNSGGFFVGSPRCRSVEAGRPPQNDGLLGLFAVLLYNLMLPANLVIHTKAWGNYAFIEFAMVLSFYFFARWLRNCLYVPCHSEAPALTRRGGSEAEESPVEKCAPILLGFLFAFSFWANMQSIYFIFVLLSFFFLVFLLNIRREFDLFALPALGLTFLNLYFLSQKRMIFNPALSVKSKLGMPLSPETVSQFNIPLLYMIFAMWVLTILWLLRRRIFSGHSGGFGLPKPIESPCLRSFLISSNLFFLGAAINIYHDSFSRISAEGPGMDEMWAFFQGTIVSSFIGKAWPIFLVLILAGTIKCLINFLEKRKITWSAPIIFSSYAFPLLFIISGVPKITPTPRYLLIWWVPLVLSATYGLFVILNLIQNLTAEKNISILSFFPKCQILPAEKAGIPCSLIFPVIWLIIIFNNRGEYLEMRRSHVAQAVKSEEILAKINQAGELCCAGGYWEIGPVMAASGLDVKCYSREDLGHDVDYLDFYEHRYSDQNCFEIRK